MKESHNQERALWQHLCYNDLTLSEKSGELICDGTDFLDMKKRFIFLIFLSLIFCVLIEGCIQLSPSPQVPPASASTSPVVTARQTPPFPSPQTCSLAPGPIQIVPEYESVSVTVNRNSITENPSIAIVFNGGLGLGMVEQMNVTAIRSIVSGNSKPGIIPLWVRP
jgi:hypothetical protein